MKPRAGCIDHCEPSGMSTATFAEGAKSGWVVYRWLDSLVDCHDAARPALNDSVVWATVRVLNKSAGMNKTVFVIRIIMSGIEFPKYRAA